MIFSFLTTIKSSRIPIFQKPLKWPRRGAADGDSIAVGGEEIPTVYNIIVGFQGIQKTFKTQILHFGSP